MITNKVNIMAEHALQQETQDKATVYFEEILNEIDQLNALINIESEAASMDEKNQI